MSACPAVSPVEVGMRFGLALVGSRHGRLEAQAHHGGDRFTGVHRRPHDGVMVRKVFRCDAA